MSSKIQELLNEYRLYDPEKENGCDTFERCEYLLNTRFDALLGFRIKDLKLNSIILDNFKKELLELKKLKIEEYRNKYIYLTAQEIPQIPQIPLWMNGWIINIDKLYEEFETYEPYHENNCRNLEDCIRLLNSRYRAIIEWKKAKYADILIKQSNKTNPIYKYYSDKFEKDLHHLKELKTEEYRTKFESESNIVTDIHPKTQTPLYPISNPSQEYKIIDRGAQIYLEESIREHTKIRREAEYRRLQQQEYEETKKKINEQLHSLVEMPSRFFGRLMSSSKKLDINEKINIWSDKIIEMISDLSAWKPERCENLDECINKITTIIDIINSFLERPNTMVKQELPENNNYNIQKNKIYKNFLEDYKITFTDRELEHPEYLKLLEDYKKIIIVLQNMKLDDCKNTFSGGNKSKTDLRNKNKMKK